MVNDIAEPGFGWKLASLMGQRGWADFAAGVIAGALSSR
jgi:hypothetical protein